MARNEFHKPLDDGEDGVQPKFDIRTAVTHSTEAFMIIEVIEYLGKIQLDGIFGRRMIDTSTAQMLVDDLQAAIDFIEENPSTRRD